MKKKLFLLLAILMVVVSCFHTIRAVEKRQKNPWITMSRGPCYGTCPVYELEVYKDGKVNFNGREFTIKIGKYKSQISSLAISDIQKAIKSSKYFALSEHCCDQRDITDLPTTTLTIEGPTKTKTVVHYAGCLKAPRSLTDLEKIIDEATDSIQWIGSAEQRREVKIK